MTKTAAILATFLLAGCMTGTPFERQQMPDAEPRVTYGTAAPVDDTLECIETGVRAVAKSGHTVSTTEDDEARILWVTALANPVIAVRVEPVAEGAVVEYRSRFRAGMADYTTAVLACR